MTERGADSQAKASIDESVGRMLEEAAHPEDVEDAARAGDASGVEEATDADHREEADHADDGAAPASLEGEFGAPVDEPAEAAFEPPDSIVDEGASAPLGNVDDALAGVAEDLATLADEASQAAGGETDEPAEGRRADASGREDDVGRILEEVAAEFSEQRAREGGSGGGPAPVDPDLDAALQAIFAAQASAVQQSDGKVAIAAPLGIAAAESAFEEAKTEAEIAAARAAFEEETSGLAEAAQVEVTEPGGASLKPAEDMGAAGGVAPAAESKAEDGATAASVGAAPVGDAETRAPGFDEGVSTSDFGAPEVAAEAPGVVGAPAAPAKEAAAEEKGSEASAASVEAAIEAATGANAAAKDGPAKAPPPSIRESVRGLLYAVLLALNWPVRALGASSRATAGLVAAWMVFNAACLWVWLLLR